MFWAVLSWKPGRKPDESEVAHGMDAKSQVFVFLFGGRSGAKLLLVEIGKA